MSVESKERPVSSTEEMEQRLSCWIEQLHCKVPESIGDLLHFRVGPCSPDTGEYSFYASTGDWMKNAFGTLHGGIIGTILDQGMGMLATCLMEGKAVTPTVQMNVAYHRPLMPGDEILLKVHVETMTRTLIHMRSEAMNASSPERLCVSATGIFFIKHLDI